MIDVLAINRLHSFFFELRQQLGLLRDFLVYEFLPAFPGGADELWKGLIELTINSILLLLQGLDVENLILNLAQIRLQITLLLLKIL